MPTAAEAVQTPSELSVVECCPLMQAISLVCDYVVPAVALSALALYCCLNGDLSTLLRLCVLLHYLRRNAAPQKMTDALLRHTAAADPDSMQGLLVGCVVTLLTVGSALGVVSCTAAQCGGVRTSCGEVNDGMILTRAAMGVASLAREFLWTQLAADALMQCVVQASSLLKETQRQWPRFGKLAAMAVVALTTWSLCPVPLCDLPAVLGRQLLLLLLPCPVHPLWLCLLAYPLGVGAIYAAYWLYFEARHAAAGHQATDATVDRWLLCMSGQIRLRPPAPPWPRH